jgi:hypothetical protein
MPLTHEEAATLVAACQNLAEALDALTSAVIALRPDTPPTRPGPPRYATPPPLREAPDPDRFRTRIAFTFDSDDEDFDDTLPILTPQGLRFTTQRKRREELVRYQAIRQQLGTWNKGPDLGVSPKKRHDRDGPAA